MVRVHLLHKGGFKFGLNTSAHLCRITRKLIFSPLCQLKYVLSPYFFSTHLYGKNEEERLRIGGEESRHGFLILLNLASASVCFYS